MKQLLLALLFLLNGGVCLAKYTMSTFYAKNTSDKTIVFEVTAIRYSNAGPHGVAVPFSVPPHDSVLLRKVKLKDGLKPTAWFTKFIVTPADGVPLNDPFDAANWIKYIDADGKPVYTYALTK